MNIAHFTNTYKPNVNGVSRSVSTFRHALSEMGHNVFVFCQEARDYKDSEPFIFRYPAIHIPSFNYSISMPVSSFVDKLLPSLKPDLIHSNHPIALGGVAADKAEELDLALVFTFHTSYTEYSQYVPFSHYVPFSQAFIRGKIVEGLVRYLRRCNHIITPSDSIKDILAEAGGITDQVTTIPTGIDLQPYEEADGASIRQKYDLGDETVLVSVGRLALEKNWETLFDALSIVLRSHPDVYLLLVGDGPERKDLEKYADEIGIASRVIFTGRVPFEQVPNYLKAADIFTFASVVETQGLVTMEALSAGLPVVAVSATGTRDIVEEGIEGLLTENEPNALADGLIKALDTPALLARLKANAQRRARQFDIQPQAERMLQVYEQAIRDKEAGRYIKIDDSRVQETLRLIAEGDDEEVAI